MTGRRVFIILSSPFSQAHARYPPRHLAEPFLRVQTPWRSERIRVTPGANVRKTPPIAT